MTWDEIFTNARVVAGLDKKELLLLTWRDYSDIITKVSTEKEIQWLHTREILAMMYNINRKKGSSAMTGKKIIPLNIDKIEEFEPLTIEEHKKIVKNFSKWLV